MKGTTINKRILQGPVGSAVTGLFFVSVIIPELNCKQIKDIMKRIRKNWAVSCK